MTDAPSISTFDIAQVLMGRGYPETEVPFYIDEWTAVEIARKESKLAELALADDSAGYNALLAEVTELKKALRSQQFTYHLRAVPNKVRQDILKKAFEKYPKKSNPFGMVGDIDENEDRDALYTNLLWEAMTVKIVAPDGNVQVSPSYETIERFRDYAPVAALTKIDNAIQELSSSARSGFESAAKDPDFLSQP